MLKAYFDYSDYRSSLARELKNKRNKYQTNIPGLKTIAKKANLQLAKNFLKNQKEINSDYYNSKIQKYIDLLKAKEEGTYETSEQTKKIPIFNKKIADLLISNGEAELVGKHLKQFTGLDIKTAKLFLKAGRMGYPGYVVNNTDLFRGDLPKGEANKAIISLIIKEQGAFAGGLIVMDKNKKFPGMDRYIADQLIEYGRSRTLVNDIDKFPGLDRLALVEKMTDYHSGGVEIMEHLNKFPGLKPYDLMVTLLTKKQYRVVAYYHKELKGVSLEDIRTKAEELLTKKELEDFNKYLNGEKTKNMDTINLVVKRVA